MRLLLMPLCLLLAGCVAHRPRQTLAFPSGLGRDAAGVSIPPHDAPESRTAEVLKKLQSNASATQQSLQGLGVQLGQVANEVKGIEANLAARVDAVAKVNAKARVDLAAKLKADLDALAAVQTGLKNSIERTDQTVKASRDANVQTVQFTREMADTLKEAYASNRYVVWVTAGVIVSVVGASLEFSRRRAEGRAREAQKLLETILNRGKPDDA